MEWVVMYGSCSQRCPEESLTNCTNHGQAPLLLLMPLKCDIQSTRCQLLSNAKMVEAAHKRRTQPQSSCLVQNWNWLRKSWRRTSHVLAEMAVVHKNVKRNRSRMGISKILNLKRQSDAIPFRLAALQISMPNAGPIPEEGELCRDVLFNFCWTLT